MSVAKDLKCPECPEMFWSNVSMGDHMRLVHALIPVEKSLAQIAESLKPVGEFFEALMEGRAKVTQIKTGEVFYVNRDPYGQVAWAFIISPKEESK